MLELMMINSFQRGGGADKGEWKSRIQGERRWYPRREDGTKLERRRGDGIFGGLSGEVEEMGGQAVWLLAAQNQQTSKRKIK
jgi:hypothetical protein